mgnify:CR=1 FL=1
MPRPKRNFVNRGCYHITHRCHGGNYLFKFAKHRQLYFEVLRETVDRFAIDVLNYISGQKGSDPLETVVAHVTLELPRNCIMVCPVILRNSVDM